MQHATCRRRKRVSLAVMLGLVFAFPSCLGQFDLPESLREVKDAKESYWAVYNIRGSVTDKQGLPLQDIQVILTAKYINTPSAYFKKTDWPVDTVVSAADGTFFASKRQVICPFLEAVASDPAGRYLPDTLIVQVLETEQVVDLTLPSFALKNTNTNMK